MSTKIFTSEHPQVRLRVVLDLGDTGPAAETGTETETVRIKASDLRAAQRTTTQIRAEAVQSGRSPHDVVVLVDLEVMIADEACTARAQMDYRNAVAGRNNSPDTLQYVGTPAGLASLIGDIYTAGVADGVTVLPLSLATKDAFVEATLPRLERFGFRMDTARPELLLA